MSLSPMDPNSFSMPDQYVTRHINLKWDVDFSSRTINGIAELEVEKVNDSSTQLIFDVSLLTILNISLLSGESLNYKIDNEIKNIGSKLTIDIPESAHECSSIFIEYKTSPNASGLQWLDPLQTAGQKYPYMFSQFQPIHARSSLPCQDTPAVKFTYSAEVTTSSEFTVLMSALRTGKKISTDGTKVTFSFNQPVPIPSYLLAIAVGVIDSKQLGPRSTVWAEKEIIDKCAWEFADTEKMLKTAEELCGPYIWGIYDVLVLPPSFPYGGMENPCLTFVTPTLVAGDRSLSNVIVHEITHSWTGNLVTNKNFEHFWLNEGFTVFIERKISALLYGEDRNITRYRDFITILGLNELHNTVFGYFGETNPLTKLVIDLKGLSPDDAFSNIPYEKGSTFLRYLENLLGGPDKFEPFLRDYLKAFGRKSIDTNDFKYFLINYFNDHSAVNDIKWDTWLNTPGMPHIIPDYDYSMVKSCKALAKSWLTPGVNYSDFKISEYEDLTTLQRIQFLSELLKGVVTLDMAKGLETAYRINFSQNCEIKFRWLRLCMKAKWHEKIPEVLKFVNEQGRMKYVRPLYRAMYDWNESRNVAINNYLQNKKYMMQVTAHGIEKDLHLN